MRSNMRLTCEALSSGDDASGFTFSHSAPILSSDTGASAVEIVHTVEHVHLYAALQIGLAGLDERASGHMLV